MATKSDFYQKTIDDVSKLIDSSTSFTCIGVSDFGRSIFLRHLMTLPLGKFISVDVYDLPNFSRIEFFNHIAKQLGSDKTDMETEAEAMLECKAQLEKMVKSEAKVIIIFNRLDLVNFEFDRSFFDNLRTLWRVDPQKIVLIFGVCNTFHNIAPEAIMGSNTLFYSNIYYLPLYSDDDIRILVKKYSSAVADNQTLERALELSGGHFQLFQLLAKTKFFNTNPMADEFIILCLKSIYRHLNYHQKKLVEKVALGKNTSVEDEYLLETGMVRKDGEKFILFSPLFAEFIKSQSHVKLSDKENKLFRLLKNNIGQTVSRDEIFEKVWGSDQDGATDWALDALAYRLRKNPSFTNSGYILENHKKVGYSLVKN